MTQTATETPIPAPSRPRWTNPDLGLPTAPPRPPRATQDRWKPSKESNLELPDQCDATIDGMRCWLDTGHHTSHPTHTHYNPHTGHVHRWET